MYNTRSSGGDNQYSRKSDNFRPQQQPQQTKNLGTPKLAGQAQMQYQNRPPVEGVSNLPPQSQCSQPLVQATISPPASQLSEGVVPNDTQNNMLIKKEGAQANEEPKDDKTVKWPSKRKVNKKEQKKRLNARMRRLVCPKSPLMVFSELYKDVPIKLIEQPPQNNFVVYTASIEVDGQVYAGNHVSKTQAKQKACENFLRGMLAKKMNERSEKKEESFTENEEEVNENVTSAIKPKGPPQEDFPWPHFASLAMHNLIAHWELQPVTKVLQEETIAKPTAKTGMKKFPDNPETYNPVQLLHQMTPGIIFKEVTVSHKHPSIFQVLCEISNVKFNGEGSTKKAAKRECAIQAIKHFWNFDFHSGTKIIKQQS